MKRKLLITLTLLTVLCLISCGGSPKAAAASVPDELDAAIRDASDYLNDNVPAGSKIVILNVQSDSAALTDYIIDELIANAVNDRNFSVVDRQQLDLIRQEQDFQWSGEVDDNLALEVGRFFGAQTIVSGRVSKLGERYRMTIRALEVQSAQVQGQYNRNVAAGATINDLMAAGGRSGGTTTAGGGASTGSSTRTGSATGTTTQATITATPATVAPAAAATAAPAASVYKVGDTGPAGGIIFYDKGNARGGWRYLEAAPASTETRAIFAANRDLYYYGMSHEENRNFFGDPKPKDELGNGKALSELLVKYLAAKGVWNTAPQVCDELEINGFDDWFLPNFLETSQMYGALHRRELGDFQNALYWTSSLEQSFFSGYPNTVNFSDGSRGASYPAPNSQNYVRAARRF